MRILSEIIPVTFCEGHSYLVGSNESLVRYNSFTAGQNLPVRWH